MINKKKKANFENRWHKLQEILNYTDEELLIFRSNPKKVKAMEKGKKFITHNIVVEITDAHNCAMGYKVGDRFVVDGGGALILDQCPKRICIGAIAAFKPLIDRMWQAFYDGKSEVLHDTVHCPDVGVREGGWGIITMRVSSVLRKKINN